MCMYMCICMHARVCTGVYGDVYLHWISDFYLQFLNYFHLHFLNFDGRREMIYLNEFFLNSDIF